MNQPKRPQSLEKKLLRRMRASKSAPVFTPVQFLDLGTRAGVDQVLSRLVRAGTIERAGRGLYFLPRSHPWMGKLGAASEDVARAIARRDGLRIQEGGASAANELRLTEQVPARIIYDTDGPTRRVKLADGKRVIHFKHRSTRRMARAGRVTGTLISALATIGKTHITEARLRHLREELKPEHKAELRRDLPLAPVWMHRHLRYITGQETLP
ncbi:MAG: DUF6088 family protein [Limisphaerales bacterium]